MKCKWLLDSHMLDSAYHADLKDVCHSLGIEFQVVKYIPLSTTYKVAPFEETIRFNENDCVVAYGSIEFLKGIGYYNKNFVPSYYMSEKNLKCSSYLPNIPTEYLLNGEYIMLPYGEFKKRKENVFNLMNTNKLFIRPDSGLKTFAGTTIHVDDFDYEINTLEKLTAVLDDTIILISNIQPIKKEYRIVIGDRRVIASSQYKHYDTVEMIEGAPEGAINLANKITELEWQPDTAYTVDVAELKDGSFKIIELNSFSCAGLYACNLTDVVREISAIAEKEYQEFNDY